MSKFKRARGALLVAGLSMLAMQSALPAATAEEAKALGTTLTPFGAEKEANKDGSIPAYSGGVPNVPGYDPKSSRNYLDPFGNEKPLYSVDARNLSQYADVLTEGTKALFRAHQDFRVDVYPTHRSVRYPSWVLDNTLKNATTAKLGGQVEGDAVMGADKNGLPYPGVPFPIPKNGYEVMWNYKTHYKAAVTHTLTDSYLVDSAGGVTPLPTPDAWFVAPWYDRSGAVRKALGFDAILGFNSTQMAPPSSAGIVFLNFYLPTADNGGQKVWFYTPGQRRVRLAPEFAYDVPIAAYGGVMLWDEVFGFTGRLDRFDFKLVGKKEMLVPYNVYGMTTKMPKEEEYLGPKFVKPEGIRFEKHRVWVVDATRKPNARHVYARRTFYVDEDCWCLTAAESYDDAGKVWRTFYTMNYPTYDVGGVYSYGWITYDLIKGNYMVTNTSGAPSRFVRSYESAEGLSLHLTPQSVAEAGVR